MMHPSPAPTGEDNWLNRPLAIIGMSCRLPGADGLDEYWDLLASGRDAIGPLPESVLNRKRYFDPQKGVRGKSYSDLGGLVSPKPVDPLLANRIGQIDDWDECHVNFCSVAVQACLHAGLDPFDLPLRNVGVFVGHSGGSPRAGELAYRQLAPRFVDVLDQLNSWKEVGNAADEIKQRLTELLQQGRPVRAAGKPLLDANLVAALTSRTLGLSGPHMAIDAACASSLIALALGANSLHAGEADMVIVGGAAFNKADSLILFSQAQSCSARGSKPFDADADGLIGSEGYVALVIKTLPRALADGDHIQAVIRGIGIASDGRGKSLWAPRSEGQLAAVERAYGADLAPASIQLIEAHATSTQVGDATEVKALADFFKQHVAPGVRIPLGSVKSNIGHTLETAGLAGLVKVVLSMQRHVIPPSIHVQQLNPAIRWDEVPLEIARTSRPWVQPSHELPRRAAVNAFGIGGLNVHVVVEEHSSPKPLHGRTPVARELSGKPSKPLQPIAIIGRGVVLPGAVNSEQLASLLAAPRCMFSTPPFERLGDRSAGFVTNFEYDWRRHKVPPKQIAQANPLQFMLLEAAEQAINEAGLTAEAIDRKRTAVVVGNAFGGDFGNALFSGLRLPELRDHLRDLLMRAGVSSEIAECIYKEYETQFLKLFPALLDETGSFTASTLASRLTKSLDMMGGAMAVDAGDCSGLASLNVASRLLQSGVANYVLAAAAHRSLDIVAVDYFQQCGGDMSSGLGEGVALVLLMRLDDALRAGRKVFGVLPEIVSETSTSDRSHAMSIGGKRSSAQGHVHWVNSTAYSDANLATMLDCPQTEVMPSPLRAATGYLQGVQAMADVISCTHNVEHRDRIIVSRSITGQVYMTTLQTEMPAVHANTSAAGAPAARDSTVDRRERDWMTVTTVTADKTRGATPVDSRYDVKLSAGDRDEEYSLYRLEAANCDALAASLNDLSSGAIRCVQSFSGLANWRVAIVGKPGELAVRCRTLQEQLNKPAARHPLAEQGMMWAAPGELLVRPTVAWMFPGQGSQRVGMLRDLVSRDAAAAEVLCTADDALARLGQPNFARLAWDENNQLGIDVWQTQAAMLIADAMLLRSLQAKGLQPDVLCGHSFGEFAALLAAGCWDLQTSLLATWHRCQTINEQVATKASMLSVQADRHRVEALIRDSGCAVALSHINSPDQMVVGGEREAILRFTAFCEQRKIVCRTLSVPTAFHTAILQPAVHPFQQRLQSIALLPPTSPIVSSVTNQWHCSPDGIRQALAEQLVTQLDFVATVQRLQQAGVGVFVEVGPQQVLTRLIRAIAPNAVVVSTDNAQRGSAFQLLCAQATLELVELQKRPPMPQGLPISIEQKMIVPKPVLAFDATQRRRERMREEAVRTQGGMRASVPLPVTAALHFDTTEARRHANRHHAEAVEQLNEQVIPSLVVEHRGEREIDASKREQLVAQFLVDFVVEQTGYPAEIIDLDWDMEADLGIDSIKKAQLFGELREFFDLESVSSSIRLDNYRTLRQIVALLLEIPGKGDWLAKELPSAEAIVGATSRLVENARPEKMDFVDTTSAVVETWQAAEYPSDSLIRTSIQSVAAIDHPRNDRSAEFQPKLLEQFLIDFVVEHTGYPPEVVELEADLEADLGIDSIKKAQLLGELRDTLGSQGNEGSVESGDSTAQQQMKSLSAVRTLGDIMRLMAPAMSVSAASFHARENSYTEMSPATSSMKPEVRHTVLEQSDVVENDQLEQGNSTFAASGWNAEPDSPLLDAAMLDASGRWRISARFSNSLHRNLLSLAGRKAASNAISDSVLTKLHNGFAEHHNMQLSGLAEIAAVDVRTLSVLDRMLRSGTRWSCIAQESTDGQVFSNEGNRDSIDRPTAELDPAQDIAWLSELHLPSWLHDETQLALLRQPWGDALTIPGMIFPLALFPAPYLMVLGLADAQDNMDELLGARAYATEALQSNVPQTMQAIIQVLRRLNVRHSKWLVADAKSLKVALVTRATCDGHGMVEVEHLSANAGRQTAPKCIALGIDWQLHQFVARLASGRRVSLCLDQTTDGDRGNLENQSGVSAQQFVASMELDWPTASNEVSKSNLALPTPVHASGITQRYVLRMVPTPLRDAKKRQLAWFGTALIIGDNPIARQLEARLSSCGVEAIRWSCANQASEHAERFEQLRREKAIPHLFLTSALDAAAITTADPVAWQRRMNQGLMSNFWLCQKWNGHINDMHLSDEASLVVVTSMGGDFGLGGGIHSVESGGLAGLTKSMMVENWTQGQRTIRFKIIDTHPLDIPAECVSRICDELKNPNYDIEVAYRRSGERLALRAQAAPLKDLSSSLQNSPALQPGSNWVFTGGARGITALVAETMAARYGMHLHLIGTLPLPQIEPKWHELSPPELLALKARIMTEARDAGRNAVKAWQDTEKLIEIDATLKRLRSRGLVVHYHQCDVADPVAVKLTLMRVRELSGPIHGIVHGAGVGRDARFDRKQPEKVQQCITAKVDGALALMDATKHDPLQFFVAFGSISGRFGANGHADYSLANEMLCKQVAWYQRQRPETKCIAFHWHAWGDIGMATKPETKLALEMIQMQFMPAAEGVQHLIRELESGEAETEVLITDERYFHMYYPSDGRAEGNVHPQASAGLSPLITECMPAKDDHERNYLIPVQPKSDPFLNEHCLDSRPLLPMVMAAEMFLQAGQLELRTRELQLLNLKAHTGLRFYSDAPRLLTIKSQRNAAGLVDCSLHCDFLSRDGRLIESSRKHFSAVLSVDHDDIRPVQVSQAAPCSDWVPIAYPGPEAPLWHGPALRKLRKVRMFEEGLIGKIAAPATIELTGPLRDPRGWMSPSATLDACLYAAGYLAWHRGKQLPSLPLSMGSLVLRRLPLPGEACEVHLRMLHADDVGALFDFTLVGVDGQVLCQVNDYRIAWLARIELSTN